MIPELLGIFATSWGMNEMIPFMWHARKYDVQDRAGMEEAVEGR